MTDDVIIVGAGLVGICCAVSLARRGKTVRLIDRDAPGQATSYGNAGVISPWSIAPQAAPGLWKSIPGLLTSRERPLRVRPETWPQMVRWGMRLLSYSGEDKFRAGSRAMIPLCGPSITLYRRHLQEAGINEALVEDSCYIHAYRRDDGADLNGLEYRVRAEAGARLERLNADELHEIEPDLGPAFRSAVVIHDQARALSPGRLGAALAENLRQRGVAIETAAVTALASGDNGWTVQTEGQSFSAAKVILSAGAWSAGLLRPLGIDIPLMAERGYHMQFRDPGIRLNNSIMDVDAKIVASSMTDGMRVAGGAEFGSLDAPPDPKREALLRGQARRICPSLDDSKGELWMGRRPSLPDSLPALGPLQGVPPGLITAFGHSHYGLMMAPATGEIIADMVTNQPSDLDVKPYDPHRFA